MQYIDDENRNEAVNLRISADLKAMLRAIATVEGQPLAGWVEGELRAALSRYISGLNGKSLKYVQIMGAYRKERAAMIAAGKIELGMMPGYGPDAPPRITQAQLQEDLSLMGSTPKKLTVMLNFKTTREGRRAIKAAAAKENRSVSNFIRTAVQEKLEALENRATG